MVQSIETEKRRSREVKWEGSEKSCCILQYVPGGKLAAYVCRGYSRMPQPRMSGLNYVHTVQVDK